MGEACVYGQGTWGKQVLQNRRDARMEIELKTVNLKSSLVEFELVIFEDWNLWLRYMFGTFQK